ncbi:MAG TPA: dihydroxyacetone kinase subunit DhaL [Pseudogracilibacillus sp.]|nr:dihydroxyacetone kinase subunit DhaL [Pseudogracilibacillus sp.]
MDLTVQDMKNWLLKTNEKIKENKDYLTKLDQAIGDGDHGINMVRGFEKVAEKLEPAEYAEIDAVLKDTAMTLMSSIGGASGPLYATAFLKWTATAKGLETLDQEAFAKGTQAAVDGIKQRGKATEGEKTMIEVWARVNELVASSEKVTAEQIQQAANTATEDSKEMEATKGRAAYFKEKSIGHIDPGCASSNLLFEALAEVMKGNE